MPGAVAETMSAQRDAMKALWKRLSPDVEAVARAYAEAEAAGSVARNSNRSGVAPGDYAKRLIRDGLAKGWLGGDRARQSPGGGASATGAARALSEATGHLDRRPDFPSGGVTPAAPESVDYLRAVHDWRHAFRPSRVRVLLVAESHVAAEPGDERISVKLPAEFKTCPDLFPVAFCRLVYCLGYGESAVCSEAPVANGGTWQYWDLFGAIARVFEPMIGEKMPRRQASRVHDRLGWKLRVLDVLKEAGVWLEDASRHAIYSPSQGRLLSGRAYVESVRHDFVRSVWPGVAADEPEQVWVIGRAVASALAGLATVDPGRVVSQPQDRDSDRYRADVARLALGLSMLRPTQGG